MKKITAILMTALLLVGMLGTTAFAAEDTTVKSFGETDGHTDFTTSGNPNVPSFSIKKTIIADDAVDSIPNGMKFSFNISKITGEEIKNFADMIEKLDTENSTNIDAAETSEYLKFNGPTIDVLTIEMSSGTFEKKQDSAGQDINVMSVAKEITIENKALSTLSAIEIAAHFNNQPGLYVYKVTENTSGASKENADGIFRWSVKDNTWDSNLGTAASTYDEVIPSQAEYILIIPVAWKDTNYNELKINLDDAIILKTKNTDGTEAEITKVDIPVFENIYQRNHDNSTYGFKVKKTVVEQYLNKSKTFDFALTVNKNATEPLTTGYKYTIYDANDQVATNSEGVKQENLIATFGAEIEFKLAHNQYIIFDKFPEGTTYTLKEINATGYKITASVVNNVKLDDQISETGSIEVGSYEIKGADNKVDVTNAKVEAPLTGIVTDNLSFILLIVVATVGMTTYVVLKKRLRAR